MPYTNRHPATQHFQPLFEYGHLPEDLAVRQAVLDRSAPDA